MPLPAPWNSLEESIASCQDFSQGAEKLAGFFQATEERIRPDELFKSLLNSNPGRKWMERFLFCLLDAGASDTQTGLRALEGRRVRRLLRRASVGAVLAEGETRICDEMRGWLSAWAMDFEAFELRAHDVFARLLHREPVDPAETRALGFLIRCEAEALRERIHWLSENADPYDMKAMARILPRLRVYDESVDSALRLSEKIVAGGAVGETRLTLESQLREAGFNKWISRLENVELLRPLFLAMKLQREKRIPTMDLVALSTLCRYIVEARNEKRDVLDWILMALRSYGEGDFSVEAGSSIPILKPVLSTLGLKVRDTSITGDFRKRAHVGLIGKDLLTRPYSLLADEGSVDMKTLLSQNMGRDGVLEALLNNAKVYQTPGMVGFVAMMSRSAPLLSKIAKFRHLHSGAGNKDVPLALLENPVNIPMTLLRHFIGPRHVGMADLRRLAKSRSIRADVRKEVEEFITSHG